MFRYDEKPLTQSSFTERIYLKHEFAVKGFVSGSIWLNKKPCSKVVEPEQYTGSGGFTMRDGDLIYLRKKNMYYGTDQEQWGG